MGKAVDISDLVMDVVNLGFLLIGNKGIKKALDKQNRYALAMVGCAVVVSLANTGYIVYEIRKNGAKLNVISRTDGKSKHNWDGSGNHRNYS